MGHRSQVRVFYCVRAHSDPGLLLLLTVREIKEENGFRDYL